MPEIKGEIKYWKKLNKMKHKILILTMGILTSLFGYGQDKNTDSDKIFPEEKFSILEATLTNGNPVVGSFNMSYKNYSKKSKYPWCLSISIGLKLENCKENGLPKAEESSIANRFEDELLEKIKSLSTAHYVGHLFNDSFLDVYIYLDDPEKVHEWLQTQINKESLTRGLGYEINQDPKWENVKNYLN